MNKDAVLGFVKKNALSLSCGVVALLAVGATFYPLGGMQEELTTDANTQAADYSQMQGLTKERHLPMSDPMQTDPGVLKAFPNQATIKDGQTANTKWTAVADQILTGVVNANRKGHDLLVAGEVPDPQFQTIGIKFATLYKWVLSTDPTVSGDRNATAPLVAQPDLVGGGRLNLQNDILHGCLPPTPAEWQKAKDDLLHNVYEPQRILKNGVAVNDAQLLADYNIAAAAVPQKMKSDAAKKHMMYVEANAFTVSPDISSATAPPVESVWYAQMQLWVQQDLVAAMADENSKATCILDAPVKHLLSIQVPAYPMYTFLQPVAGGGGGGVVSNAMPTTPKESDPIPPTYTVSPSGRYSNGMYDVVPFKMTVDVDASKVNDFIETLSNGRNITILNQNLFSIDTEAESDNGYIYGNKPTVRLQLDGEILFMRAWTGDLMPLHVKMGSGTGGAPGQGGGAGGGMEPGPRPAVPNQFQGPPGAPR